MVRTMRAFVHRSSSYGAARLRADAVAGAYAWTFRSRRAHQNAWALRIDDPEVVERRGSFFSGHTDIDTAVDVS